MTTVEITEFGQSGRVWKSSHRTADQDEAMRRAITKHFGERAWFHRDSGLTHGLYGQIFEPVGQQNPSAHTSRTSRIRINVEQA